MKLNVIPFAAMVFGLPAAARLPAQTPDAAPKVLMIQREHIKEGREAAHAKVEEAWPGLLRKGNVTTYYLGMSAESGAPEVWFLTAYDSLAAMEKSRADLEHSPVAGEMEALASQDGELRSGSRTWLAMFRDDLSYRQAEGMASLPKCRHMAVTVLRIKYGRDADLAQAAKLLIDADERSMSAQPVLTYQVISGGPSGTYLIFSPMDSLARLDAAPARAAAARQIMGERNRQHFDSLAADVVQSSENLVFAFSPQMSHVSKEFAAADPDFWNAAPKALARPPRRGRAAKPAPARR